VATTVFPNIGASVLLRPNPRAACFYIYNIPSLWATVWNQPALFDA